jgi:hypothetical protein
MRLGGSQTGLDAVVKTGNPFMGPAGNRNPFVQSWPTPMHVVEEEAVTM